MKHIIDDDVVLSRPLEGPLAAQIAAFAKWARGQGYALQSRYRRVLLAAGFSRWLGQQTVKLRRVSSEHPARYLRSRARRVQVHTGDAAALKQFLDFLRRHGVIPAEKISRRRLTPVEHASQGFERYLRDERALARTTLVNYVPFVRDFLTDRFGHGPVTLSRLCAGDVVRFVQRQVPRLHLKRAKLLTSALRSFLQYARYRGDVALDLAAAVPTVANWSMTSVPRAIPADHVRQLVNGRHGVSAVRVAAAANRGAARGERPAASEPGGGSARGQAPGGSVLQGPCRNRTPSLQAGNRGAVTV